MILILFSWLFVNVIILTNAEPKRSIFIDQEALSKNLIMISCTISGDNAKNHKLYLHCPLADTNFCYKDCSAECRYEAGKCLVPVELKSIENCERKVLEDDHVQIQYTVSAASYSYNYGGEWYCSFEGINSKSIKLKFTRSKEIQRTKSMFKSTKPKIIQTPESRINKGMTTVIPPLIVLPQPSQISTRPQVYSKSSIVQNKVDSKQETDSNYEFTFKILITKYQVVIGIICLLTVSVLLNFIFYIRDSLIKQFIDNIKHNTPTSKYLLCFICQNESTSILDAVKQDKNQYKESDYASNAPSSCSKHDSFNVENHRPLITSMYSNNDWNTHVPSNMVRSKSLLYQEPPRPFPVNYEQFYMTTPRGIPPYTFNPYFIPGSNLEISTKLQDNINQKKPTLLNPHMNPQGSYRAGQIPNKNHASENDIDLIKNCDDHEQLS